MKPIKEAHKMKLVMTAHNPDGTIAKTQALMVTHNQLKKIGAPGLSGKYMYRLKKHRKVEIDMSDGKLIYVLLEK